MIKIINIKKDKHLTTDPNFQYIGRGTTFGNPHSSHTGISRTLSIGLYRNHLIYSLKNGSIPLDMLLSLDNKILGCSCKPMDCHGDIIIALHNMAIEDINNDKPIRFFDVNFKFNDKFEEAVNDYDN